MAVWQYQLIVIPQKSVVKKNNRIPPRIFSSSKKRSFYINYNWWKDIYLDTELIKEEISKFVSLGDWTNDKFFGWKGSTQNYEDNDAFMSVVSSKEISEFQFRTDLRDFSNLENFLKGMLKICNDNQWLVMNINGELFYPEYDVIIRDIVLSNSYSYVKNPNEFMMKFIAEDQVRQKRENSFWYKIISIIKG